MMKRGNSNVQLAQIRELIETSKQPVIHAVLIPSSDAHHTGQPVDRDRKINYLTGFTGPSAIAVVTLHCAAFWTGKKWHYQAELQLDENWTLMKDGLKDTPTVGEWLCSVLPEESNIAVNPRVCSADLWNAVGNALKNKGQQLVPHYEDVVDKIWKERPTFVGRSIDLISPSRIEQDCYSKIDAVKKHLHKKGVSWLVITALDEVAWLLNLTGSDLPFSPLFFAYVVIGLDDVHLFVEAVKLTESVKKYLDTFNIIIHEYHSILEFLKQHCNRGQTWLSKNCTYEIMSCIKEMSQVTTSTTPVAILASRKTKTEIEGIKEANNRDAVAFCRFLHWLESNVLTGKITECAAGEKLNEFRKEEVGFVNIGFDMMSCSGANSSILLYCNSPEHDVIIKADEMYMIDSGAFFRDQGCTDSCRTVHYGSPTQLEKEIFTLVLKAHIDLAMAIFPVGSKGHWLVTLAKMPLWEKGLDFDTRVGHGIGFFQSNEGPPGILISHEPEVLADAGDKGIVSRMFFTDEPGYYERNKFGVRIENTLLTRKAKTKYQRESKEFLDFEVVSFIPIQTSMIIKSMLEVHQVQWLNNYHQECLKVIGKRLQDAGFVDTYMWLQKQTAPI